MIVTIKNPAGQSLNIETDVSVSVQALKEKIQAALQVPVARQRLFYQSQILDNSRALSEYGVTEGAELQLTDAAAGASGQGAAVAGLPSGVSASLWVGDLDKAVTWQTLYEVFNPVAPVASIRVCRHHITHESLGYAYVNFHTPAEADKVLNTMNYTPINGRPCRIMWSERDASARRSGKGNIFIKNLNPTIDVQMLHDTFSKFGNVLSCKVALDQEGKPKGYAFVAFTNDEEADAAIAAVDGKKMEGYQVRVRKYVPRSQRTHTAEWNNVFVKDFPTEWDEAKLRELFADVGEIQSVYLPQDEAGQGKGFAFVCFASHAAAAAAVEQLNGKPMSLSKTVKTKAEDGTETEETVSFEKPLFVARAQKKDERRRELEAKRAAVRQERISRLTNRNLYVRNLDESITEDALKEAFAKFGPIESVRIARDDKGRSKLFGYVCFQNQQDAAEAESGMNNQTLAGKPIAVFPWLPKQARKQQVQQDWQRRQESQGFGQQGGFANPGMYYAMARAMQQQGGRGFNPAAMAQMQQAMMAASMGRGGQMNPQQLMQMQQMMQMQMQQAQMMQAQAAAQHGMAPGQAVNGQMQQQAQSAGPAAQPAAAAPPAEQRSLADVLAQSDPEQRRQIIGTALFRAVQSLQPDKTLASKITGMLLDSTGGDTAELLLLVESPQDLSAYVTEAMKALQSAQGQTA